MVSTYGTIASMCLAKRMPLLVISTAMPSDLAYWTIPSMCGCRTGSPPVKST